MKIFKIISGEIKKWNTTNNIVVKELYDKLTSLDGAMKIIFKHLLVSTDVFLSELFGINSSKTKIPLQNKEIEQFYKLYSLIITFYAHNISMNNENYSEEINNTLYKYCPSISTVEDTIKIFHKFSKTAKKELSNVGSRVIEEIYNILNEDINIAASVYAQNMIILIACYNSALESIHKELETA